MFIVELRTRCGTEDVLAAGGVGLSEEICTVRALVHQYAERFHWRWESAALIHTRAPTEGRDLRGTSSIHGGGPKTYTDGAIYAP